MKLSICSIFPSKLEQRHSWHTWHACSELWTILLGDTRFTSCLRHKVHSFAFHSMQIISFHAIFVSISMMFGIGTKDVRLEANKFINMLGEDNNGWGLSHKGIIWHGGRQLEFTKRFTENQATRIGLLFDGHRGTLTYYKDGQCLGVAFEGLDKVKEPLYPIVTSTAAKTEMTLGVARREFANLQDRCRAEILKRVKTNEQINQLELPFLITRYLRCGISTGVNDMRPVESMDSYMV